MKQTFLLVLGWFIAVITFTWVICWVTPFFLMKIGILKYACMQPMSLSMQANSAIAFSPLLMPGILAFLLLSGAFVFYYGRYTLRCIKAEAQVISLIANANSAKRKLAIVPDPHQNGPVD